MLNNQILTIAFLSFTLLLISADSAAEESDRDLDYNGSDCIWIRTIRDYTTLDDRNLLIWAGGKRAYFVTLLHPSFEMKSSMGIGFSSRDDHLCPYGGDSIVVGGLSRETVSLRSISRVSAAQADQLLVRYGKKEGPEPQATEPVLLEGAEVEELD